MIADTLPFERAVKKPEDVIFNPLNRKLIAKILNPISASSNVAGSCVNTVMIQVASTSAITVRIIADTATKRNAIL